MIEIMTQKIVRMNAHPTSFVRIWLTWLTMRRKLTRISKDVIVKTDNHSVGLKEQMMEVGKAVGDSLVKTATICVSLLRIRE